MPRPRTAVTGGIPERYAKSPVKAAAFERVRNASIAYEAEVARIEADLQKLRDAKLWAARAELVKSIQRSLAEGLPKQGVAIAYGVSYTRPIDDLLDEFGAVKSTDPRYLAIEPGTAGWVEFEASFTVVSERGPARDVRSLTSQFRRLVQEPGWGGVVESAWVYAGVSDGVFYVVGVADDGSGAVWFPTNAQYQRFAEELDYPVEVYPYPFSASYARLEE